MNKETTQNSSLEARARKTTIQLAFWTSAWVMSTALTTFGPEYIWDYNTTLSMISVLLQLGFGFGMIFAHKQHLVGLDDLMRKIQLEAMAIALGVGLVVGLSYEALEASKLITFEPEISHLIVIMALTCVTSVVLGYRRYK